MKTLYKILLTLNATSWVVVIYGIKEEWTLESLPSWVLGIVLFAHPRFFVCYKYMAYVTTEQRHPQKMQSHRRS